MTHEITLRVYYEDTDLAGIVYYANYLKFIERGRSEWVRTLGVDQGALRAEAGIVFAVRRVEADYLKPAQFDDLLTVTTALVEIGGARIVLALRNRHDHIGNFIWQQSGRQPIDWSDSVGHQRAMQRSVDHTRCHREGSHTVRFTFGVRHHSEQMQSRLCRCIGKKTREWVKLGERRHVDDSRIAVSAHR